MAKKSDGQRVGDSLIKDACLIIENARDYAFRAVNVALTIRNWQLGERICREHLDDDGRAEYGKHIIESLSQILSDRYGKGFDFSSLYQYVKFYKCFPEILDAVESKIRKSGRSESKFTSLDTL